MATQKKATRKNTRSKIPVGKFIPARLNPDGTVSFVVEKGKHKGARAVNPKRVKNISEGFYAGGVFHPIRSASDYRPEALSGSEGQRARGGIRKTTRKPAARKKAKKRAAKRKR